MALKVNYTEAQWIEAVRMVTEAQEAANVDDVDPASSPSPSYTLPQGKANIVLPVGGRQAYNIAAKKVALSDPSQFVPLDLNKWSFVHEGQNYFRRDFAKSLNILQQEIEKALGLKKVVIISGYRTPEYNERIRNQKDSLVAKNSPHMGGIAVDLDFKGSQRYLVADIAYTLGFGGIAIGTYFVHIDVSAKASWTYPGVPKYISPSQHGV